MDFLFNKRVFFDGAMGTMLMSRGLEDTPEFYNLTHPQVLREIHAEYAASGCDVITTNTFGANRIKLPDADIPAVVKNAVELAKTAGKLAALDIGPSGGLLKPLGNLDFEDAYAAFSEQIIAGRNADMVIIETMSDLYELKAAVLAAKENCDLPVIATVTLNENGKLLTGADIPCVVALLEGLRVDALGLNCSLAPSQVANFAAEFLRFSSLPVLISPNAGLPLPDGTYDNVPPERYAADMRALAQLGVRIMGGCCGTTPAHIKAVIDAVADVPLVPLTKKSHTIVTSGQRSVIWDKKPVIIGERLNPTGKSKLKAALKSGDIDYIQREALAQGNADVLDVNVGLPELNEPEVMVRIVKAVQSITPQPLQIDSADPGTIEKALRLYNGKAMINSVGGTRESMESIFPLAAKYGGVLIALPLDENGIPETAEGRVEIAKRIVKTAESYGIAPKDIVIDGLAMAVGSDPNAAVVTLETVKALTGLGLKTLLGISNVSYGMPDREALNASFYTMALNNGLSCAIINPCAQGIMGAYKSYCVLSGIELEDLSEIKSADTLGQAILYGLSGGVETLLTGDTREPLDIINSDIIPALNTVGANYESGKLFLPQLIKSAETAQTAFAVLQTRMGGKRAAIKGKIVIATVKGDIHDIGKNLSRVLIENYGYEVIDLGKDVAPEEIVALAEQHNAPFVGLSALMTTTVKSMELTIKALKNNNYGGKILVSGAVMNAEYAEIIGADIYVKDAIAAVNYMEKI
jgi:5-methyltetrahydrofolate--homocysteine methyltransferase